MKEGIALKKFQFPLDRMRSYKDQLLEEEINVLAQLRHAMHEIEAHIDKNERDFEDISADMLCGQAEGITIQELRTFESKRDNIRRQLQQLYRDLDAARKEVYRQTEVVVAASQEVEKLDKLKDKQKEEYRQYVAKAEEVEIDEFVMTKRFNEITLTEH